jgi:hypothetical protein
MSATASARRNDNRHWMDEEEWTPDDEHDTPWAFVLRANVQRRQLTKSQIAALIVDGPEYEVAKQQGLRAKSEGGRDGGTSAGRGRPKLKRDEEPGSSSLSEPSRAAQSRDKRGCACLARTTLANSEPRTSAPRGLRVRAKQASRAEASL